MSKSGISKQMKNILARGKIICLMLCILIYPLLILYISGDWFWIEGWIFSIWFIAVFLSCAVYLYRKDPALLAERFRRPGYSNQKGWDKYFLYVLKLVFLVWFVIMPLDVKRFGWSANFPIWLKFFGGIGLLNSSLFLYRSFTDNTFLSPLVRIQTERKHHVVSTGAYAIVRHPMYLGAIFMFLGTPSFLGSYYGILIGTILSFLLVGRIIGEEKMLVKELEGYADYKQKVKYRLIPFVW